MRNKVVELKKRGFEVFVFHAKKGPVYIYDLKEYSSNFIPELRYPPICFRERERHNVVSTIIDLCDGIPNDSIIDTSCISNLEWGELIAKKCNCKCVGFLVDERFKATEGELEFLRFKQLRKELAGTSQQSLKILFGNKYTLTEEECYFFNPYCSNTVDDVDHPVVKMLNKGEGIITIGFLGRLDKGYMIKALEEVVNYTMLHPTCIFNIVVIGGGSSPKYKDNIERLFNNIKNVNLIMTGFIFPIPRSLLKEFNVCISSAASARVVANEGIPTVYVNAFSGKPVGIMNYTMSIQDDQKARYSEEYIDMTKTLDDILFGDYMVRTKPLSELNTTEVDALISSEIDTQLNFIKACGDRAYYEVTSIRIQGKQLILFSLIGKLCGGHMLYAIHIGLFSKLRNILSK